MGSGRLGGSGAWLLAMVLAGCGCSASDAPDGELPPAAGAPSAPGAGTPDGSALDGSAPDGSAPDGSVADAGRADAGPGTVDAGASGSAGSTRWLYHPSEPKHELSGGIAASAEGGLYTVATHGAERGYSTEGDAQLRLVVTRLSPGGAVVWTRAFPITRPPPMGDFQESGSVRARIAADAAGDVLLAGELRGSMDLGGGALATGSFVAKLSSSGGHRWSSRLPEGYLAGPVAADAAGNAYVGVLGSGPSQPDSGCVPMVGRVVKYAADGGRVWDATIGEPQCDGNRAEVRALAVDVAGRIALGGAFSGVLRFGERRFSTGRFSPYLAVLEADGSLAWLAPFSTASGSVSGVSVSARGAVVATGFQASQGHVQWGSTRLEASGESTPLFLLVAEAGGQPRWAKDLGAGERPVVTVEPMSSLVVAGLTRTFRDPSRPAVDPAQNPQLFASRFQLDGTPLWTRIFRRKEGRPDLFAEEVVGAVTLPGGSSVLAGQFTSPTDFGTGRRTSAGTDVFVLRLAP